MSAQNKRRTNERASERYTVRYSDRQSVAEQEIEIEIEVLGSLKPSHSSLFVVDSLGYIPKSTPVSTAREQVAA